MTFLARACTGAFVTVMALAASGCHTARPLPSLREPDGSRIITRDIIASARATNAWDLLRECGSGYRLVESARSGASIRTTRGQSSMSVRSADQPLVVLDGILLSDPLFLRQVPTRNIFSVRMRPGITASTMYGTNSGAGVIEIRTGTH